MLVVARLVLVEAVRRRLLLAVVLLTTLAVALTGWGFSRIPTLDEPPPTPAEIVLISSQLLILVAFMFSFVLALSAVFVAAPSVSAESESGVALAILARPISRTAYIVGKWLGLAALLLIYTVGAGTLELVAVRIAVGYEAPRPIEALAFLYAEGLILLTFALALSTRVSGMVGGVVALVLFGLAWMGGIVGGIGQAFDNALVMHVGTVTKLVLPTDALWRGVVWALEPAAVIAAAPRGMAVAANPFFASSPPPLPFLVWSILWTAAALGLAVWSFRRREV